MRFTADLDDTAIDVTGPVGHYGGYESPQNQCVYYEDHSMALNGTADFE